MFDSEKPPGGSGSVWQVPLFVLVGVLLVLLGVPPVGVIGSPEPKLRESGPVVQTRTVAAVPPVVEQVLPQQSAPSPPTNLKATAGNGEVLLSWSKHSDSSVTGFKYQWRSAGRSWSNAVIMTNSTKDTTYYRVKNLTNNVEYRFKVSAYNANGDSLTAPRSSPWYVAAAPRASNTIVIPTTKATTTQAPTTVATTTQAPTTVATTTQAPVTTPPTTAAATTAPSCPPPPNTIFAPTTSSTVPYCPTTSTTSPRCVPTHPTTTLHKDWSKECKVRLIQGRPMIRDWPFPKPYKGLTKAGDTLTYPTGGVPAGLSLAWETNALSVRTNAKLSSGGTPSQVAVVTGDYKYTPGSASVTAGRVSLSQVCEFEVIPDPQQWWPAATFNIFVPEGVSHGIANPTLPAPTLAAVTLPQHKSKHIVGYTIANHPAGLTGRLKSTTSSLSYKIPELYGVPTPTTLASNVQVIPVMTVNTTLWQGVPSIAGTIQVGPSGSASSEIIDFFTDVSAVVEGQTVSVTVTAKPRKATANAYNVSWQITGSTNPVADYTMTPPAIPNMSIPQGSSAAVTHTFTFFATQDNVRETAPEFVDLTPTVTVQTPGSQPTPSKFPQKLRIRILDAQAGTIDVFGHIQSPAVSNNQVIVNFLTHGSGVVSGCVGRPGCQSADLVDLVWPNVIDSGVVSVPSGWYICGDKVTSPSTVPAGWENCANKGSYEVAVEPFGRLITSRTSVPGGSWFYPRLAVNMKFYSPTGSCPVTVDLTPRVSWKLYYPNGVTKVVWDTYPIPIKLRWFVGTNSMMETNTSSTTAPPSCP